MNINEKTRKLAYAAATAALYVVLTLISAAVGLSSGVIQFRISEMLTVLPVFTGAAVPGLFIGCVIANLVTGVLPWDVAAGSLATLIGACLTYAFRSKPKLATLFPVLSNGVIVPFVLMQVYKLPGSYCYFFATVTVGEAVCCCGLGYLLYRQLLNRGIFRR